MTLFLLLVAGVAFYISLSGVKRRLCDVEHLLENQQRETEEINRRLQAMKKALAAEAARAEASTSPVTPPPITTAPVAARSAAADTATPARGTPLAPQLPASHSPTPMPHPAAPTPQPSATTP